MRIDACLQLGSKCGQPAADEWCRRQGFGSAAGSKEQPSLGKTIVLGSGQLCQQPSCGGFSEITCTRVAKLVPEQPPRPEALAPHLRPPPPPQVAPAPGYTTAPAVPSAPGGIEQGSGYTAQPPGVPIQQAPGYVVGGSPAQPAVAVIDLSGRWTANVVFVYQITQTGDKISYQDPILHKPVNGTVQEKTVTVSWAEGNAVRNLKGTITSVGGDGRANRIQWENGFVFERK